MCSPEADPEMKIHMEVIDVGRALRQGEQGKRKEAGRQEAKQGHSSGNPTLSLVSRYALI